MKRIRSTLVVLSAILILAGCAGRTVAGEFNPVIDIGDPAPRWTDLPTTNGKTSSLDDLRDAKVVVVVFTCNTCPYAVDAEQRLIELTKDYADSSVVVVAINVNTSEDNAMPAMKVRARTKSFPFTYVFDKSQQIARDYGAKNTPQFFVLDSLRHVAYMGSLDDSPDGRNVTQSHVRDAIDALLAGKTVSVTETVPIGCRIRTERPLRSRKK